MKRTLLSFLFLGASLLTFDALAQTRYLDPIFNSSQITITQNVVYGQNIEVLTGAPVLIDLKMDVYQPDPAVDPLALRPLIIIVHTGNFLPIVINGSPTGTKMDSSVVNLSKQWAQRGFVVASIDYRLGWNPLAPDAETRRALLLQAVYRSIIDTKTAVRYFKKDAATTNTFEIDPSKIILYGEGSGGYTTLAYNTLDRYAEVELPKFTFAASGESYIDTTLLGNIDGYGGAINVDNHVGYSAEVAFVANAGGALADTSWLEANAKPMVTFHAIRDGYAPFNNGIVIVPTTNENVVEVQGPNLFMAKANALGVNSSFANLPFSGDPYTARARSMYGNTYSNWDPLNQTVTLGNNMDGLFPVELPLQPAQLLNGGGPWQWWDLATLTIVVSAINAQTGGSYDANTIHAGGMASNPGMSAAQGLAYIDSIQGYLIPRVMVALQLPGYEVFSVEESEVLDNGTQLYPVPASDYLVVELNNLKQDLAQVVVINQLGQTIRSYEAFGKNVRLDLTGLSTGVYVAQIILSDGNTVVKKFTVR